MRDALELQELIDALEAGFREAADSGRSGLHVQISVPFASQYEWVDDYGAPRSVHLPTDVHTQPADEGKAPVEDGGPAATFSLLNGGIVPGGELLSEMAAELYRRAIGWGQAQYGSAAPVGSEHPPLPVVFETLVEEALAADVHH